jgi:L-lactate dehydrogenase (cytochrome)
MASRSPTTTARQLDRAPIPFHLLPEIVREVGKDTEVHLDTGIMSGADIVASIALGARFTLTGRAYLYGLMAGGRTAWTARSSSSPSRSRARCACSAVQTLEDLSPAHVSQLGRLIPRLRS